MDFPHVRAQGGLEKPIGTMPVLGGVAVVGHTDIFVWQAGVSANPVGVGLPGGATRAVQKLGVKLGEK